MDLPIRFPKDEDVIAEDAARFRALSPLSRLDSIRGMIDAGELLMRISSKSAFMREYTAQQEDQSHLAIREFIARHAR